MYMQPLDMLLTGLSTLILMIFHGISPKFNQLANRHTVFITSFAAGIAISYVFLNLLPHLVEYNEPIGALLAEKQLLNPITELGIFIVALIGFIFYFGLELVAEHEALKRPHKKIVYHLHLMMFCINNFIISYTLPLKKDGGHFVLVLFTFTMSLHFIFVDLKFNRLYSDLFKRTGRLYLMLSLLFGWLAAVLFEPIHILAVAMSSAFLAGSIMFGVFKEELPKTQLNTYLYFVLGTVIISSLLLAQTYYPKLN